MESVYPREVLIHKIREELADVGVRHASIRRDQAFFVLQERLRQGHQVDPQDDAYIAQVLLRQRGTHRTHRGADHGARFSGKCIGAVGA